MTSLAFMAGLVPLVRAHGAGAIGNHTLGASALGGMIAGTVLGVFLIPGLYVIFGRWVTLVKEEDHQPLTEEIGILSHPNPTAS